MPVTNLSLTAPTDYTTDQQAIQRRLALAQAMQTQGMTPINTSNRMAGGMMSKVSPWEGAAKLFQAYMGGKGVADAEGQEKDLTGRYNQQQADALAALLKQTTPTEGTPEQAPATPNDDDGNPNPSVAATPAYTPGPADITKAISQYGIASGRPDMGAQYAIAHAGQASLAQALMNSGARPPAAPQSAMPAPAPQTPPMPSTPTGTPMAPSDALGVQAASGSAPGPTTAAAGMIGQPMPSQPPPMAPNPTPVAPAPQPQAAPAPGSMLSLLSPQEIQTSLLMDPSGKMAFEEASKRHAAMQTNVKAINPAEYTPDSLAKFSQTRNFTDLVPVRENKLVNLGGTQVAYNPYALMPGQTFTNTIAPDAALSAQTAARGQAVTMRGQNMTDARQREQNGILADGASSPNVEITAQAIVDRKLPPLSGFALARPSGQATMARVMQLDPSYNAQDWQTAGKTLNAFANGPQGNTVRSLNVVTQHIAALDQAAAALKNGNIQAFNKIGNFIAAQTGQPAPTTFGAMASMVGDEATKAIIGAKGAASDREKAQAAFSAVNSPAQWQGVRAGITQLMGGQLNGLRQQYQGNTGRTDFDSKFLSPETQSLIGHAPAASAGAHPPDISALLNKYGAPPQ